MLNLIDTNPNDTVLVDRFLVLAADMPEHEKLTVTIRLARTLLKRVPRKAIEVAWMVYNSSLRDEDSLKLIAEAFEQMGKHGKADLIRSELKRIANNNLTPEVRNLARLTVEEHVTTTLAEKPTPAAPEDVFNERDSVMPMATLSLDSLPMIDEIKTGPSPASGGVTMAATEQVAMMNGQTVMLDQKNLPGVKSTSISSAQGAIESKSPGEQKIESVALPSAGIPAAIPAKEPSKISIETKSKSTQGLANAKTHASVARPKPEEFNTHLDNEVQLNRLEELADSENWDRLLSILQTWFPNGDHPYLLGYFERRKIAKIDIRYAEFYLDVLISAKQERRALRFMINKLTEEPQLAWARMMLPKVEKITGLMALTPIKWRESDGVLALRNQMAAQKPRFGCYWAS